MAVGQALLAAAALVGLGAALVAPWPVDQRAGVAATAVAVLLYLARATKTPPDCPGGA